MSILIYLIAFTFSLNTNSFTDNTYIENESLVETVSFTLHNKSLKSIPLIIPGVMKPNLSPKSKSGVTLKVGQKILFKYKGKREVLFIVSPDLDGKTVDVAYLLKKKKNRMDGNISGNDTSSLFGNNQWYN